MGMLGIGPGTHSLMVLVPAAVPVLENGLGQPVVQAVLAAFLELHGGGPGNVLVIG